MELSPSIQQVLEDLLLASEHRRFSVNRAAAKAGDIFQISFQLAVLPVDGDHGIVVVQQFDEVFLATIGIGFDVLLPDSSEPMASWALCRRASR